MNKFILDSLSTCVIVLNENLDVEYMNSSAEHLTTVSADKAQGKNINELFLTSNWLEELQMALESGHPFTWRQEEIERLSDQKTVSVDCTATAFTESSQKLLLLELQPIDRLIRINREEALVSSQQTSHSMVRGLAHEIKNPLGGIRGSAQLLSRELESEALKDYTTVIIEESDRLRDLVDRMLGSNKPLKQEIINIHEVVERVASLIDAETEGEIKVIRDYDPSIPAITGDQDQLIQATLNIARNAMQALQEADMDNKTISLQTRIQRNFTIGNHQHKLACRVNIIDNGPGVPEDIQDDIFYPMISGRAAGTGLGLALSQSIVIQHNGLIECSSKPGRTEFSIYLPLGDETQ